MIRSYLSQFISQLITTFIFFHDNILASLHSSYCFPPCCLVLFNPIALFSFWSKSNSSRDTLLLMLFYSGIRYCSIKYTLFYMVWFNLSPTPFWKEAGNKASLPYVGQRQGRSHVAAVATKVKTNKYFSHFFSLHMTFPCTTVLLIFTYVYPHNYQNVFSSTYILPFCTDHIISIWTFWVSFSNSMV